MKTLDPELVQYSRRVAAELAAMRATIEELRRRIQELEQKKPARLEFHRDAKGFIQSITEE